MKKEEYTSLLERARRLANEATVLRVVLAILREHLLKVEEEEEKVAARNEEEEEKMAARNEDGKKEED